MLLSELPSHSDLHMAEGMAFEDMEEGEQDAGTTILSQDQSTYANESSLPDDWPCAAQAVSPLLPVSTAAPRSSKSYHQPHGVKDRANVVFGSSSPTAGAKTAETRHRHAQRLGVNDILDRSS